ncbi:MAG: hypothetical protein ABW118_07170 [Candidatus Thiodiazotropha sp.]
MDLIQTLPGRINKALHRYVTHINKEVLEAFERYQWPGNVREPENIPMKSIALSQGDALTRNQLPEPLRMDNQQFSSHPRKAGPQTEQSLEDIERIDVKPVLDATGFPIYW